MDCIFHGIAKSPVRLSVFFVIQFCGSEASGLSRVGRGFGGGSFPAHPGSTCCGTTIPILCWLSAGAPHPQDMAPCTSEPAVV